MAVSDVSYNFSMKTKTQSVSVCYITRLCSPFTSQENFEGKQILSAVNVPQAQTGPCWTKLSVANYIQQRATYNSSKTKREASMSHSYKSLAPKYREDGGKFTVLISHFSGWFVWRMCNAVIRDSQWHFHKWFK